MLGWSSFNEVYIMSLCFAHVFFLVCVCVRVKMVGCLQVSFAVTSIRCCGEPTHNNPGRKWIAWKLKVTKNGLNWLLYFTWGPRIWQSLFYVLSIFHWFSSTNFCWPFCSQTLTHSDGSQMYSTLCVVLRTPPNVNMSPLMHYTLNEGIFHLKYHEVCWMISVLFMFTTWLYSF